jgi:tRNA A37 threonylcarbamoyladenosine dehydratase
MERFLRTKLLLGDQQFANVMRSRVLVVGLGAVGGYVVEALARGGVGALKIVDFDSVQPTNINRQLLALEQTIGKKKIDVARERIMSINPDCNVEAEAVFVDEDSLPQLLDPEPDLIIDAIDSLNPKVQLLAGAHDRGIPVISSMGAALRTDPGCIRSGDISNSFGCPLAKRVRKRLRRRGIDHGITCVYSSESTKSDGWTDPDNFEESGAHDFESRGRKRNILGSLPTITGIFGLVIANQALLLLAGREVIDE